MYGLLFDDTSHTRLELSQSNSQTALDGNTKSRPVNGDMLLQPIMDLSRNFLLMAYLLELVMQ